MSDLNDKATDIQQVITDAKNIVEQNQDTNLSTVVSTKAMETSKKLLWILVTFFIISIVAIGVVAIIFTKDLSYLLNYETPLVTSLVIGYLGKSGYENGKKIDGSNSSCDSQIK